MKRTTRAQAKHRRKVDRQEVAERLAASDPDLDDEELRRIERENAEFDAEYDNDWLDAWDSDDERDEYERERHYRDDFGSDDWAYDPDPECPLCEMKNVVKWLDDHRTSLDRLQFVESQWILLRLRAMQLAVAAKLKERI